MADLEPCVLIVDDEKRDIELVEEALSPIRLRILKLEQLSTMLSTGAAVTATSKTTEAAREGMAAFVEKRSPEFP